MKREKKIYDIRGEVIEWDESEKTITLKLFDDIDWDKSKDLLIDNRLYVYLDLFNKLNITDAQRKYFWALMGDYENYTGYPRRTSGDKIIIEFTLENDLEKLPSTRRNGMSKELARELLQYVIEDLIDKGVPFHERKFYLAEDVSKLLYALTMKRMCWVCGKPGSSIHHAEDLVGMGRDRTKHNHLKSRFMCLCESGHDIENENKIISHHQEAHSLGLTNFCEKYHVQPIKLDEHSLRELGIRGDYPADEKDD